MRGSIENMRLLIFSLFFCLSHLSGTALAAAQDSALVKKAVEDYLRIQVKGLPGQASFSIGTIAGGSQLTSCPALDVSMPPGARAWGRTQVLVRCLADGGWTMFVPVQIKVSGDYLVTSRPLTQGTVLAESDLMRRRGELSDLPTGILTDPGLAIGRTLAVSLPAGRPVRGDMLRQATVVLQNQNVRVVSKGRGFSVANEGRALTNATEGQVVQVRLANGQVISGVARAGGMVEIAY